MQKAEIGTVEIDTSETPTVSYIIRALTGMPYDEFLEEIIVNKDGKWDCMRGKKVNK